MKTVILAGGLGTRISEETGLKPKPMIEIGGKPILWHIMKIYSTYGLNDFIICCGYKGYMIKEFFANYFLHSSDVTIDLNNNTYKFHKKRLENWKITLVDTGEKTNTGGRLKRIKDYLEDEDFCMTYGDGLSNINIKSLIKFHRSHGKKATLSAVKPPGRFGALKISRNNSVSSFKEKPQGDQGFITGVFLVLSPKTIESIEYDSVAWEKQPLEKLSSEGELMAFKHDDFWQPMDTLREKNYLESLVERNEAPWILW